ncbi:SPP1 family predicted phage head-tail adaptor [Rhodobacter sp. JA431]|uniref:phage head closure protein n=1 Tax=Rhodobacter sp. JA431 TaxID=570013 RepID=UPI000BDA138A|nr:phage head closure protein [Rhodobacter sp. JA431]SOC11438.1 SPP1 family predicted phage head-tail adaptor [Rhodobacter sp. JA431]
MARLSLNTRITVQRAIEGDDGYSKVIIGWADLEVTPGEPMKLWADVQETPGKERVAAGRIEASRTAMVTVRATPSARAITAANRVIARGQVWNIRSVSAVGDGRGLIEMLCEVEP